MSVEFFAQWERAADGVPPEQIYGLSGVVRERIGGGWLLPMQVAGEVVGGAVIRLPELRAEPVGRLPLGAYALVGRVAEEMALVVGFATALRVMAEVPAGVPVGLCLRSDDLPRLILPPGVRSVRLWPHAGVDTRARLRRRGRVIDNPAFGRRAGLAMADHVAAVWGRYGVATVVAPFAVVGAP